MDKRLPFEFDEQTYLKLCSTSSPDYGRTSPRLAARSSSRAGSLFIYLLLSGVILLQLGVIVAALILSSPTGPQAAAQAQVEALHVPAATPIQPVLPPRLFPDDQRSSPIPTPMWWPTPEPPTSTPPAPAQPTAQPPTRSQPLNLRWRGMEITQGIQVFNEPENPNCVPDPAHANYLFCNNSVPLVARRHTLVRAYPACQGDCPTTDLTIRLRLLRDGQEQVSLTRQLSAQTLQQLNNRPLPELRAALAHSVNFEFFPPPDWMVGQITFVLETVLPDLAQPTPDGLTLTKEFAVRKPLRIAYLPIQYQGITPPEPSEIDYWLLRMYPVPGIEYYRLPIPTLAWQQELGKGEILNKLLFTYWLYAQYQPALEWPDQLFGWLPQDFFNGGVSDPFWCPNCAGPHSSRVAFGGLRPEPDIGGPRILVHEIAHNLGAQHAWSPTQREDSLCFKAEGVDIQVDPDWPYAETPNIQEFGIDLYSNPPIIYPPAYYDMMAYCYQPWISPFTYRKLFDSPFLQPDATAMLPLANFQPQAEASPNGTLLVSGVVYRDGTVAQPEIIQLEGNGFVNAASIFSPPGFTPPAGDDYCLEVQAADGATLAQQCFDVGFADVETGQPVEAAPFFVTLPAPTGREIGQVTISQNDVALVVTRPSHTPPVVTVTFPNGGEMLRDRQTITWQAFDADGDPLLYDLLYSADGGRTWLPLATRLRETNYTFYTHQIAASRTALLRVMASDGFHTGVDESDGLFTIEASQPNSISLHSAATVQIGQTFEVAVAAHQLTEPGLFGVQFQLHFDPARLQVQDIRRHPDLSLAAVESIDQSGGLVTIAASRQGRVSNLTGDITLAAVTFTAISEATETHLYLSQVKAAARGGLPLILAETQPLSINLLPR